MKGPPSPVMVSECFNPQCAKPLHYLREGRIYLLEVKVEPQPDAARLEHFWLCGPCSTSMFVEQDGNGGARVVSRFKSRRPAPVLAEDAPMAS